MHGLEAKRKAGCAVDVKAKALIEQHSSALQNFLAKHVDAGGGAVEEITQETFLALVLYLRKNKDIENERALVYKIARSKLVDHLRANSRRNSARHNKLDDQELISPAPSNERALEKQQELTKLLGIVEALPPKCRQVFELRTFHEMTPEEIAAKNAISVRMVFKHMNQAMKKIREQMDEL